MVLFKQEYAKIADRQSWTVYVYVK